MQYQKLYTDQEPINNKGTIRLLLAGIVAGSLLFIGLALAILAPLTVIYLMAS